MTDSNASVSGSRKNCCSPTRNVDQPILQHIVDELEDSSCGAQSEYLRVLHGHRIVRVQYLRGCHTRIDSGASAMTTIFHLAVTAKIQYWALIQS
jgi:hypothetical protein